MTQLPITSSEERARNRINWIYQLFADLQKARKIVLDPERAIFLTEELDRIEYTAEQAKRARVWILFGDWKMRGADPTLELSDFFPDDDQYHTTVQRMNARKAPKPFTAAQPQNWAPMGAAELKWWALEMITIYEPKLNWKLHVPFIDEWRDNHAEHTLHLQNRKSVTPPPAGGPTRLAAEFAEFRKRYLDADGFLS